MHFPPSLHILFQASSPFQDIPNTIAVCGGLLTGCGGAVVVGDVAGRGGGGETGRTDEPTLQRPLSPPPQEARSFLLSPRWQFGFTPVV